jgi:hypothetical protein
VVSMTLFPSSFPQHFWCIGQEQERPKLAFLPPWLLGCGPIPGDATQLRHNWTLSPNG